MHGHVMLSHETCTALLLLSRTVMRAGERRSISNTVGRRFASLTCACGKVQAE
jgi:hypothetical protein